MPAGERIKALYDDLTTSTTRTATRCRRPRSCPPTRRSPPRSRSTSATGRSSWSTPAAATPAATWWSGVPDADVLLAGDLVEESMLRHGVPGFGADCYPMEWPLSLDIVLGLATAATPSSCPATARRSTATSSRSSATPSAIVAETIRDLATRGVPVDEALDAAEWPYPREELGARRTPRLRAPPPQPEAPARSSDRALGVGTAGHDELERRVSERARPRHQRRRSCPRTSGPSEDNPLAEGLDAAETAGDLEPGELLEEGKTRRPVGRRGRSRTDCVRRGSRAVSVTRT